MENEGNMPEITPAPEVIKIDELDIGEFHPDAAEEPGKYKRKLIEIEECIKEVKELAYKVEKQKREFAVLEQDINDFIESENDHFADS